jgi:hypothetical protein
MKRYLTYSIISLFFTILIIGCAQWGGDNPLGITGGSEEGYGQGSDLNLPDPSGGSNSNLVGSWRYNYPDSYDYMTWTFNANGNLEVRYHLDGEDFSLFGTYSTSGNAITINLFQEPVDGTYSINGDQLTIYIEGDVIILYRVTDD